jgi:hypothetical protein
MEELRPAGGAGSTAEIETWSPITYREELSGHILSVAIPGGDSLAGYS